MEKKSLLARIKGVFYEKTDCPYHKFTKILGIRRHEITNPKTVRAVRMDWKTFGNPGMLRRTLGQLIGKSLILDEGESWQAMRHIMMESFTPPNVNAKIAPIMLEECDRMIAQWKAQPAIRDTEREMLKVAGRIIMRTLFSDTFTDEQYTDIPLKVSSTLSAPPEPTLLGRTLKLAGVPYEMGGFLPGLVLRALKLSSDHPAPIPRSYKKSLKEVDDILYPAIAARRRLEKQPDDVVGRLIEAVRPDTGKPLTDKEIKDQLVMLIAAGHETTAESLTFSIMEVAKHPEVQKKLRDDFNAVTKGAPLAAKDIGKLAYTDIVLKESMRLHPPVYMSTREAFKDAEVGGIKFKKNDLIETDIRALHKAPEFWPDAGTFDPGRFEKTRSPGSYMPFGAGPRVCVGMTMSMVEGKALLSKIFNAFDITVTKEPKGERYYFTTRPDSKMELTATPRTA